MVSDVQICNNALVQIGHEPPIASFNEASKAARACNALYAVARDELLRSYIWRFSLKRQVLAPTGTNPPFDEGNYFNLPSDLIRLVGTSQDQRLSYVRWRVEGRQIIMNDDQCDLLYVRRVEDTDEFDPIFVKALVYKLAFELCGPLTRDNNVKETMFQLYQRTVRKAAFVSATEHDVTTILSEIFLRNR